MIQGNSKSYSYRMGTHFGAARLLERVCAGKDAGDAQTGAVS